MATPPNTLLEPLSSYPVFEPNQLLSSHDLNAVRDYLDQQTRLTRVCLTGVGIVCGLVPRWKKDSIVISAGCGVTTEGFLMSLDACTLTHYQKIENFPLGAFLGTETSSNETIVAYELFEEASDERTALPVSDASKPEPVVVLLLEYTDDKNETCIDDCDEKGTEREFKIRKLLIDTNNALAIAEENFNPKLDGRSRCFPNWTVDPLDTKRFNLFTERYKLEDLYLERFGQTEGFTKTEVLGETQVTLTTIESYKEFVERYRAILKKGIDRVSNALSVAHLAFSPLFSREIYELLRKLPKDPFSQNAKLEYEDPLQIQYVYDHLADLILAYNEFLDVAFGLMDVCCPDRVWFPRHLLLGAPLRSAEQLPIPPSATRTPYLQPPVYNENRQRVAAAWMLFERMRVLIQSFQVPPASDEPGTVRITPSRWGTAPLSDRAIPYYYHEPEKNLVPVWNADRHRKARDQRVYGYFQTDAPRKSENRPYDDPLVFDFEGHNFYRIEGHVGRDKQAAFDTITDLRERYNLAFDLVVLKLGKVNENDFRQDPELQLLQAQYTNTRNDLDRVLDGQGTTQHIKELQGKLVGDLNKLGSKSINQSFEDTVIAMCKEGTPVGNCLRDYDYRVLSNLSDLYQHRKKKVLEQTFFHEFAKRHPGMEHKAGVPRGGTFILVCNEREMVVADFCLPYFCCADSRPTTYILPQSRPTLLIQPRFCANDDQEYDFHVDPPGGKIQGPGTDYDVSRSRYYFVPNEVEEAEVEDGSVEVTYCVNGVSATLTLHIEPVPQANFQWDFQDYDSKGWLIVLVHSIEPDQPTEGPRTYHFSWTDKEGHRVYESPRLDPNDFSLFIPSERVNERDVKNLGVYLVVVDGKCMSKEVLRYVNGESRSGGSSRPVKPDNRAGLEDKDFLNFSEVRPPSFREEHDDEGSRADLASPRLSSNNEPENERRIAVSMAQRLTQRQERFRKLAAEHEAIEQNKGFERLEGFLDFNRPRSTVELVEDFGNVANTLKHAHPNVGDEHKEAYRTLTKIAVETLIDRIAVEPPDAEMREKAAEHLTKLRDVDVDLDALREEWLGSEMASLLDEARKNVVRGLFD